MLTDEERREIELKNERIWRERNKDVINARRRERYATDPEYRAIRLERSRTQRPKLEYRAKRRERHRERYATDPEYREKKLERARKQRERIRTDPELMEHANELKREQRRKRKEASDGS